MLKDLLEKFNKEFYELSQEYIPYEGANEIRTLAHSHIEAAYQSNLEKLIEKCGDYFGAAIKTENGWKVGNVDFEETLPGSMPIGTGKTFTEAVENLIKALGK